MQNLQKVFALRNTELFSHLPSETLLIIAEETQAIEVLKGQRIFSEGEQPTGLYILVSGAVQIMKGDKVLTELKEHDFFGELGLIDNSPRSATAIAKTDGVVLFLEKHTFDRVTDDVPEVLRAVIQVVMRYLRSYMNQSKTSQKE